MCSVYTHIFLEIQFKTLLEVMSSIYKKCISRVHNVDLPMMKQTVDLLAIFTRYQGTFH